MRSLTFKKALTIVLLGSALSAPSLHASDNLHDRTAKEARTWSPLRASDDCNESVTKSQAEESLAKRAKRLPFEEFRLNRNSRGPVLLH